MRRKSYRSYVLLILLLFGCLNLPSAITEPMQVGIVRFSSPLWRKLLMLRLSLTPLPPLTETEQRRLEETIQKLEAEKAQLSRQNEQLKRRLLTEERLTSHSKKIKEDLLNEFFVRRQHHLKLRLQLESQSLFAQVIYRQPSTWNSSVWIDVGLEDNQAIGFPLVSVNSPVLAGEHLIGIVEFVGKKQSRVRLLTDSSLVVAVRAVRGGEQRREMLQLVDQLYSELSLIGEEVLPPEEKEILSEKLEMLKAKLQLDTIDKYLAKGEIFGTSSPLWRSRSPILKGIGFNYDFEDVEGPARELRTGKPYGHLIQDEGIALIQEGDLLITTGMDGIFPPDLPIAFVSKVDPLKEGAASYSIEAVLCHPTIDNLSSVIVLPSLEIVREELF